MPVKIQQSRCPPPLLLLGAGVPGVLTVCGGSVEQDLVPYTVCDSSSLSDTEQLTPEQRFEQLRVRGRERICMTWAFEQTLLVSLGCQLLQAPDADQELHAAAQLFSQGGGVLGSDGGEPGGAGGPGGEVKQVIVPTAGRLSCSTSDVRHAIPVHKLAQLRVLVRLRPCMKFVPEH